MMRYPHVDVYVRPVEGLPDDGSYDQVERVVVDGVEMPVIHMAWEASNDRGGTIVTLKVRGQLRIHQETE